MFVQFKPSIGKLKKKKKTGVIEKACSSENSSISEYTIVCCLKVSTDTVREAFPSMYCNTDALAFRATFEMLLLPTTWTRHLTDLNTKLPQMIQIIYMGKSPHI